MRSVAIALVALVVAGCSAAPPWISPDEHQRLTRQILELERRSAQAELEIARLKQRLSELEGPLSPAPAPARAPAATVAPREDEPTALAPRPPAAAIEESELGDELAAPAAAAASDYERGLVLLRDGRTAEAEQVLARFAAEHPASDLADNAWFWIGESRLARGETAAAIAAYRECLERYPEGNKVPDAMLKLGQAFALSGEREAARETWSELTRRFPSTVAAETARERLAAP